MRTAERERGPGGVVELSFGEQLAAHRVAAGLTQEELACRAGLSVDAISLLERGSRSSPRSRTIRVLADALELSPHDRDGFVAAARPRLRPPELRVPHEFRLPSTPFVDRAPELAQLRALLGRPDVCLVTLTGPPGVGKTRLALEAADALASGYRHGAVLVPLGAVAAAGQVLPAVRRALDLEERSNEPALETVVAHCRQRQLLLVLDNFEHVLAASAELVALLGVCPGLELLVTSRAALRVRGEHELEVPPLPEAAAVRLFLDRAGVVTPGFGPADENAAPVAAICRCLDGVPLALELAARWMKVLTPAELLSRLDSPLEMLVDGPVDLPERQRTMRAALSWSCELLDPDQRALLRRLSVFAGSAPLDALDRVCEAAGALEGGALRHLGVLASHSLVRCVRADGVEPRVALLESIREYAAELLSAAGEREATARAHVEHYAELAVRARGELDGPGRATWLGRLVRDHDNLRVAQRWAAERAGAAEPADAARARR